MALLSFDSKYLEDRPFQFPSKYSEQPLRLTPSIGESLSEDEIRRRSLLAVHRQLLKLFLKNQKRIDFREVLQGETLEGKERSLKTLHSQSLFGIYFELFHMLPDSIKSEIIPKPSSSSSSSGGRQNAAFTIPFLHMKRSDIERKVNQPERGFTAVSSSLSAPRMETLLSPRERFASILELFFVQNADRLLPSSSSADAVTKNIRKEEVKQKLLQHFRISSNFIGFQSNSFSVDLAVHWDSKILAFIEIVTSSNLQPDYQKKTPGKVDRESQLKEFLFTYHYSEVPYLRIYKADLLENIDDICNWILENMAPVPSTNVL
jgi:hypothetical protein